MKRAIGDCVVVTTNVVTKSWSWLDIGLTDVEETRLKIRLTAAYDAADRSFYSSKYLRYIVSLLGCASVGPKYLCCDHSFNLRSLRIHIVTPTDVIVGFLFLFFPFCVLY